MKKLMLVVMVSILSSNCFAQFINSVKVKGGLIFPTNSQNGTSTSLELTHALNSRWSLYSSFNFSNYDRNRIFTIPYPYGTSSYSEDQHNLYSIAFGGKLILNTIETFNIYADFELGYNYLSYNEYDMFIYYEENSNKLLSFYPNHNSKKEKSESLFGVGVGLGFTQNITSNYGFSIEYKRLIQTKNMEFINHYFALNLGLFYVI